MRFTSLLPAVFAVAATGAYAQGLPPRAAATEYQAQAKVGDITIGAEFVQHSVPTPDATFTTEDYIMVETGLFGPAGKKLLMAPGDFSMRINGKKQPIPSQPFEFVQKSLKSPQWEEEQAAQKVEKSRMSLGGGGGGGNDDGSKPPPPKMTIEVQRAMDQKVKRASYPEGDRPLPAAGLLYFEYHGNVKGLKSIELIYSGPAGKVTIPLQP